MKYPRITSEDAYKMAYRELIAGKFDIHLSRERAAEFLESQMCVHLTEETRAAIRKKVDAEPMP